MNKSEDVFNRSLNQKTVAARDAVHHCVLAYLSPTADKRESSAKSAFKAVSRLREMLDKSDYPGWLFPLMNNLTQARDNYGDSHGVTAVRDIASELLPQLEQHQWRLDDPESVSGFDFDSIYKKYQAECKIPELFDEIIKWLKEIVDTEAIDSVRVIRELNEIIATLQSARDGSYLATLYAWYFATTWFKNTGWELLGGIPVAGSIFKGLRKTLEDGDKAMQTLHDNLHADLKAKIIDFPRLGYQPQKLPPPKPTTTESD